MFFSFARRLKSGQIVNKTFVGTGMHCHIKEYILRDEGNVCEYIWQNKENTSETGKYPKGDLWSKLQKAKQTCT